MNHLVNIELQRVQTFLFAVPRLADIVGANALLGEVLRYRLVELAQKHGSHMPEPIPILSSTLSDDPLSTMANVNNTTCIIADNPSALWRRGILARDGGHFRALFPTLEQAATFAQTAQVYLRTHLPGLRCDISVLPLANLATDGSSYGKSFNKAIATAIFSLPMLQQCQEAGNGPATHLQKYRSDGSQEHRAIGQAAKQRKEKWKAFKNNDTTDIAALMSKSLHLASVETFEALCGNDYLALIHADGNGLGKSVSLAADGKNGLEREAAIEGFFQSMRVTLRRALKLAVEKLYAFNTGSERKDLQILMLGGDDLLLACRAPLALPLTYYLAEALVEIQSESDTDYKPLTIGVGIAIAKPAFPFHRLHDLAEELAASAKRLVRNMETPVSVVDWAVCSEAWYGDLKAVRSASSLLRYKVQGKQETLALSAKPYRILTDEKSKQWSLQDILEKQQYCNKATARSQLRELVRMMRKGRRQADSAFLALQIAAPKTWQTLEKAGFNTKDGASLWQLIDGKSTDDQLWLSYFADWVEVLEIPHLQTQPSKAQTEEMDESSENEIML